MRPLSARDLLLVWEQAEPLRPAERALVLLAAARPDLSEQERSALTLGRRETWLLALYQGTFGPAMELVADCPACREPLELALEIPDLEGEWSAERDVEPAGAFEIEEGGLRLLARPPDGGDLAALAACSDDDAARLLLVERCVLDASREGVAIAASSLFPEEIDLLSRSLAEIDPRAELLLDLVCPVCGTPWQALLDAADCLWREIDAAARRLLREIHALARAYHWAEADI